MNMNVLGILMDAVEDLIAFGVKPACLLCKLIGMPSVPNLTLFKADDPVPQANAMILPVGMRYDLHLLCRKLRQNAEAVNEIARRLHGPDTVMDQICISVFVSILLRNRNHFKHCHASASQFKKALRASLS